MNRRSLRATLYALPCLLTMVLSPLPLHAQAGTGDPFAGVSALSKGATGIKEINLNKHDLHVAAGMSGNDVSGMQQMDDVSVHTYDFPKPGMYDLAAVKQYADKLRGDGWQQMVYKQEGDELSTVATRDIDGEKGHELAIVKAKSNELKFVYLRYRGSLAGMNQIPFANGTDYAPDKKQHHAH